MRSISIKRFYLFVLVGLLSAFTVIAQTDSFHLSRTFNTTLKAILVNGDIIENFKQDQNTYYINLPYSTNTAPSITVIKAQRGNIVKVFPATNLFGIEPERTTRILVSSYDKSYTENFKLIFKVLPKLDLYLLIGHSNRAARGMITSDNLEIITNVFLLTANGGMEPAINPLNKYSNIGQELMIQPVDPEYIFSKKIVEQTGANIGLIVNTTGAGGIASWEKGNSDHYYEKTLYRVVSALKWGSLKAILWYHGDNDINQVNAYLDKLSRIVVNFRIDLGYPQVLFVASEMGYGSDKEKEVITFNQTIQPIKKRIPYSEWVADDDLNPLTSTPNSHLNSHLDTNSQWILGERYADKVLKFCY